MIQSKFEPGFERKFRSQYLNKPLYRTGFFLAIVLYGAFGILDLYMLPETKNISLIIRYAIVIPILIALLSWSFLSSFNNFYIPLTFAALLVASYGIIAMIYYSNENEPGFSFYFSGLTIAIYFIGLFSELRFAHSFYLVLLIISGYLYVAIFKQDMMFGFFANPKFPVFLNNIFFLFTAGILSLMATYLIENFRRTSFIHQEQLSDEKIKSEKLLQNILPYEVAEELKQKGSAAAKHFAEVTVMFTDFKEFTHISEKLSPVELVSKIDTYFKAFDHIISKYNIEKIKTIGDAYMCAGGLPVPNETHAEDCVKAALEIRDFVSAQSENENLQFEIRIGLHTGPVVAGIVGIKKFAYDVWGDTVNIASRMESCGKEGKVNISETTYKLVKAKFKCIHRGKILAKNKGEIDMYFAEKLHRENSL